MLDSSETITPIYWWW